MQNNLTELVKYAGVVGAGGAGFPTHVKLSAQAETVIINGAECEPLLRVDQNLMVSQASQLLEALDLVVKELGAKNGIIALKKHYHDAVRVLNNELYRYPNISLQLMNSFYPAGDEQVVVYESTGKIVPEGGIPLNVGCVVINVETALNILGATQKQSVTEKYITVTGEVVSPITTKVPIGITVKEAISLAGGTLIDKYKVINGGPMMGSVIELDDIITKTTKGLIVVPNNHSLIASLEKPLNRTLNEASGACMQCSLCSEVCPRNLLGHRLEPSKLMRIASYGSMCDLKQTPMSAYLCCGCRLCEYICVMNLQPWKLNDRLKNILETQEVKNTLKNKPEKVDPFREYKRYPIEKLIRQLGLTHCNAKTIFDDELKNFDEVKIKLKQHLGKISTPIVKEGELVEKGQLIAEGPKDALGANQHASISGKVVLITEDFIKITKLK